MPKVSMCVIRGGVAYYWKAQDLALGKQHKLAGINDSGTLSDLNSAGEKRIRSTGKSSIPTRRHHILYR